MCAAKLMKPPASGVRVRMYRHGFGDCFLLAFKGKNGKARYMLIDCGLHHVEKDNVKTIQDLAKELKAATGGRLHVVVLTHEHTDHISGFQHAMDIFKGNDFKIDDVWLSWAESLNDSVAKDLRDAYDKKLALVGHALTSMDEADPALAAGIRGLPSVGELLAADGSLTTTEALKGLRKLRKERYCRPERGPLSIRGVKGIRAYVLGPPRDINFIKKDSKKSEQYHLDAYPGEELAFRSAVMTRAGADAGAEPELEQRCAPFQKSYRRPYDHERVAPFLGETYLGQGDEWRKIEGAWLEQAGDLALHLESHRNNTSLVLAIEIVKSGDVLLFPGDAQYGNWLSWQDLEWGEGSKKVKATDLLKRTVLYKVGHHGSHNATLAAKGLKLMTSPRLAAMIPVDEAFAATQGKLDDDGKPKGWKMPFGPLHEDLVKRTRGRVLQADKECPAASTLTELTQKEREAFKEATSGSGKNFLEYVVLEQE